MSTVAALTDRAKAQILSGIHQVRRRLLGANNERLDFLMDSFYKLTPSQRSGVVAGLIGLIALFVLGATLLYFSQVSRLKEDLANSFAALHELQDLKSAYELENQNFDKLVDVVGRKTSQVRMKPFFEKIANDLGVTIEGLQEQQTQFPTESPLSDKMQEVLVDMRFPNISVPRLMNFLVEIEKSNKYMRVRDLQVRGRYGTKLFFDAQAKIRGYSPAN